MPLKIIRMFEVARGALVYSWFFYPLATPAAEQSHRVVETAVKLRCGQLRKAAKSFADGIQILTDARFISSEEWMQWNATRDMRIAASHPQTQMMSVSRLWSGEGIDCASIPLFAGQPRQAGRGCI